MTPVAGRVAEGAALKWRVSLPEAADVDLGTAFAAVPVFGPELSTKDVGPAWLEDATDASPDPERPLSKVDGLYLRVDVPAGAPGTDVTVRSWTAPCWTPRNGVRHTGGAGRPVSSRGSP
ncbi:hypothetical protein ABZX30_21740 [Streptomyces sp. NPDC004542]|uniref:hypothetical protein n=1 Tax=Streptomyces sp. NPDC004542 TaxID=3154281 RepID=UPI0033BC4F36